MNKKYQLQKKKKIFTLNQQTQCRQVSSTNIFLLNKYVINWLSYLGKVSGEKTCSYLDIVNCLPLFFGLLLGTFFKTKKYRIGKFIMFQFNQKKTPQKFWFRVNPPPLKICPNKKMFNELKFLAKKVLKEWQVVPSHYYSLNI